MNNPPGRRRIPTKRATRPPQAIRQGHGLMSVRGKSLASHLPLRGHPLSQVYLTTLSFRKFLRSARPDPSQGEHVGECCDNKLGRQRRHRVADLATHSRVHGPRFSLAWPAAVLEYEFIREALQTSLLPVAQTPGLSVVIAVSATTATCDYRVRGLVGSNRRYTWLIKPRTASGCPSGMTS